LLGIFFILPLFLAKGQTYGSASHTITVTVSTITNVTVTGGAVSFTITGANAVAGQNTMSATNQATSLQWGINSSTKKVTVQTNLTTQLFALKLVALNPTVGTAASQVTITHTAQDFLTNLGRSTGSCTLQYTAVALASQGTGTDSHTITFTIATQ